MNQLKMVKPDGKGRITLGRLADGVSRFSIVKDEFNRLILEPYVEIPAKEKWLFNNKSVMAQVKQGLKEVSKGKLVSKGSFSKYKDS